MKSKNLFLGIIILFVGIIALLASLQVIHFSWCIAKTLWPMVLVIIGISVLPIKDYMKVILLVLTLGASCLIYYLKIQHPERYRQSSCFFHNRRRDRHKEDCTDYFDSLNEGHKKNALGSIVYESDSSQQFSSPYEAVRNAHLDLEMGAGTLVLNDPCAELILANTRSNFARYTFRKITTPDDSLSKIAIQQSSTSHPIKGKMRNTVDIRLCEKPIWDFDIEAGASSLDLDFSPYKTDKVTIHASVCDMNIKMGGDLIDDSVLDIESGVSNIDIRIPEKIGCKIEIESALSNKDFIGFEKTDRHHWKTSNFDEAEKHFVIKLSCGVSNVSISRY